MYLKKLALSGFKTFADDTTLEFGPGMTAIVGPNGSGKSNLVDAILWSLGERSNKSLRAHSATDVIFNGSAERKAQGLAEVSLFFDNEDGALPLDFKEIQVSRRIFRDGEGEYAINKSKCRLRDVIDLFLDTGVGPDAYSIVSQSEIDAILSAKPEDRRNLIESAAGVQKYRARRAETRRKLDRVQADLTRVADITSELEGQLTPLAQQAELAREYDALVARLRVLQLAILAREYDVRLKRMVNLQEGREGGQQQVTQGHQEIVQMEEQEAQAEKSLRALESAMDTLQSETTEVVSRLKSTEGQLAVARERRRALTEQQEFLAQEIGLLRARITTSKEAAATQRQELEAAVASSASLSSGAADAEARLGAANAQLSEATRELQALQVKVIELMRAGQARREAAAGGRAEANALQNRLNDLQKLEQSLQDEIAQAATAQQKAAAELEATRQKSQQAAAEIETVRQQLTAAQQAREDVVRQTQSVREQRSSSQSRLGALRELEENLEGVQGGARAVMSAVKRGQLDDRYTLVADAVRAPQQIETSIEVALGAGVHNLICAVDAEAKAAINWLKNNRAGRATFLPLSNLRPSGVGERTRSILRERGVLGVASELVSFEPENRAAVEYLLGRVVVVESLDVAVQMAKRCDGGARLVTLEGELVLPAGAITGGQGKQKTSGLLARKRELDELDARLNDFNQQLQELEAGAKEANSSVEAAQVALRAAQEASNELRAQIARQEREVEHLERESRRLGSNREATLSQLSQVRANIETKATKQDEYEREAATLDEQARDLEATVTAAQAVVTQRQAEREQVSSSVAEVRADYSAAQERLQAMRRAIGELDKQTVEYEAQIRSREQSIQRAAGEDAQIVSSESELVSGLSQLQQRRDELENNAQQGRAERTATVQKLEEIGNGLRQRRNAVHAAEEELHRVEVRIASTETEIAEMVRRFEEEFQLTPEDALPHREDIEQKQLALDEINVITDKIGAMGNVNVGAIQQHEQVKERLDFLNEQRSDLDESRLQLEEIITDIDSRTRDQFMKTFSGVQEAFDELFKRVFDGGSTHLALTHPDNLLETGIDLRVQPPGKGAQDISLLSGGERALTALTFMLALLRVHPSPFVVLDEVDAPLDQSNVGRFTQLLREFTDKTQFIVITHNNGTMQAADVLYGVTMQKPGISTLMSVRLVDEIGRDEIITTTDNGSRNSLTNGAAGRNGQTALAPTA